MLSLGKRIKSNKVIPGISDHDIAVIDLNIYPIRHTQKPRSIPLYRKADWDSFADDMSKVQEDIKSKSNTHSVNDLYNIFTDAAEKGLKKHIPHKIAKQKDGLPWITPQIKRLMRKRDRLYKKTKKRNTSFNRSTNSYQSLDKKYRDLKGHIQKEIRKGYWSYIESLITPIENDNEYSGLKRFWTYIKHSRKDDSGVSTLKVNGETFQTTKDKADALNRQFESVFIDDSECHTQNTQTPAQPPCEPMDSGGSTPRVTETSGVDPPKSGHIPGPNSHACQTSASQTMA